MRTLTILSISFLSFNFSFCQLNDSILNNQKIWYNHIYVYWDWSIDTEVIGLGNDTIVNDTNYFQVLRATGGVEIPFQEYGFIRGDNERVFYRTNPEKPERLINDFSISEGDTIIAYNLMNYMNDYFIECNFICDSIRDKDFYQIQRKVFYLSTPEGHVPEQWIEGIGSYSGLLHNYNGYTGGDAFYLSCVKYSGNLIFKRNESDPCIKLATGLDDKNPHSPMILPNPIGVNQELRIRTNSVRSIFELYDAVGILVYREILISPEISIMVNVRPGIYIYRLIDDKGIILKNGSLVFE